MARFEEVAGNVFWALGTLFVAVLVLGIGGVILDNQYPELLSPVPVPPPQTKREVSMPPLKNIRLVLGRDEVRDSGERVKNVLKKCIGSPPAPIATGRGARIEAFLADATETDVFTFIALSPSHGKCW
jgi:hypothetical protein